MTNALNHENKYPIQHLKNFHINLKQWRVFHAVVECGSFANAAEFLHISQPAISYTIAKLEEQLGVRLLELEGRKATITEPGNLLLEQSRSLLHGAIELEESARHLRYGSHLEVKLAVDREFPPSLLVEALCIFALKSPRASVKLTEAPSPHIEKALTDRVADLAISTQVPAGFHADPLIEIEYMPVARPDHQLFKLGRGITAADLEREIQIVSNTELAARIDERTLAAKSENYWQVSNFDTAETALKQGLGYGWMPKHRLRQALEAGDLKVLPIASGAMQKSTFYLVRGVRSLINTEVSRLASALNIVAETAEEPAV